MTVELEQLQHFACPVCGRVRPLSRAAAGAVVRGATSGECPPGHGCRAGLDRPEHYRRFWLRFAGVDELEIRRAGGAREYVRTHGLPDQLHALADVMPADAERQIRPRANRPTRGPVVLDAAA